MGSAIARSVHLARVELSYPLLRFDAQRDCFVVWLRWVSLEDAPTADAPLDQGIRVELMLNRNTVLGPTIVRRSELEGTPVYLRANVGRTRQILRSLVGRRSLDLGLIIHGSVANAPYAALYQCRDYAGESIDTAPIEGTPLIQLQPSTPADRWQVAAHANLRVEVEWLNDPRHLNVVD
jgi:hypothetical protein